MIPRISEIEIPLLKLLYFYDSLSLDECTDKLANQFKLTSEERRLIMSNGQCRRMKYNVGWAKANLKKQGLVDVKKRGVYYITNLGKKYVEENNL